MPVCVLRRENHPLAGYHQVLLPLFSPVQEGSGKVVGSKAGGGWGVAHLLARQLGGAMEPDAGPAGGDVGLGSQPPRHKDKPPNRSTTAGRHGTGGGYRARLGLLHM